MIFDGRDTDKNREGGHCYGPVYEALLAPHRDRIRSVLEIGVQGGESLLGWSDYFPEARIVGIDNCPLPYIANTRITCHRADATSHDAMAPVLAGRTFDLIVDDGSHLLHEQLASLFLLLPYLAPGGFYCVEDVQEPATIISWQALGFIVYDLRSLHDQYDDILCVLHKGAPCL